METPKKYDGRLRQLRDRQWGKDYVPAIFATPQSATSISECNVLTLGKLGFRSVRTLSKTEAWLAVIALSIPTYQQFLPPKQLGADLQDDPCIESITGA